MTEKRTFAVESLGCRLNISEAGTFTQNLLEAGFQKRSFGDEVDISLIVTCCVTERAEATCRSLIRKARRFSPRGRIVVVGCYSQIFTEDPVFQSEKVDLIIGSFEKNRLVEYLQQPEFSGVHIERVSEFFSSTTSPAEGHTRAFLKIQDGCDYVCSYCIIPRARGASRSLSLQDVHDQISHLIKQGFKEVVLTGVNIGEYKTANNERLFDLVKLLAQMPDLMRLRLSSVEPNILNEELIALMASSGICLDHFHIPLQSGDDRILQAMRRKYTTTDYRTVVERIKKYFPNAGIGADVIVGFPGEEEDHYRCTRNLISDLPLTHLHVFPFSKRRHTTAFRMEETVRDNVKRDRVKELIALGNEKIEQFCHEQIGLVHQVLFERRDRDGFWNGYSGNFLNVKMKSREDLHNKVVDVVIKSGEKDRLIGIQK